MKYIICGTVPKLCFKFAKSPMRATIRANNPVIAPKSIIYLSVYDISFNFLFNS